MNESDATAREIVFWALWDNYSPAFKNAIIDAAIREGSAALQEEHHLLVCAIWDWIISVNNGHGLDVGDLMQAMEELGIPCPDNLKEED